MSANKLYHITITHERHQQEVLDFAVYWGASEIQQWRLFPRLISACLPQNALAALRDHPFVSAVEENNVIRAHGTRKFADDNHWGLDRIDQRSSILNRSHASTVNGEFAKPTGIARVNVFVVDSGVLWTHDEIRERVDTRWIYDRFRDRSNPHYGFPDEQLEVVDNRKFVDNHGTHVSAIAAGNTVGVAPGARIVPVRVLSSQADTGLGELAAAVEWIIDSHVALGVPSVVNMSLGAQMRDRAFDYVISVLIQHCTVVVSAGNDSSDAYYYSPAGCGTQRVYRKDGTTIVVNGRTIDCEIIDLDVDDAAKPITVGASSQPVARQDVVAPYSNLGDAVDVFAPGTDIHSASVALTPKGDAPDFSITGAYEKLSGTSMSAPFVSGVCALYLAADPTLTHQQVRQAIIQRSTKSSFSDSQLITPRDSADFYHYDNQGQPVREQILNSQLVTANRMLYTWYVGTQLVWSSASDAFALKPIEDQTQQYTLWAVSQDSMGEHQFVSYQWQSPELVPAWIVLNQTYIHPSETANPRVGQTRANIRITAPSVTEDTHVGDFWLTASDGRQETRHLVNVTVVNVNKRPQWLRPPEGLLATVRTGDVVNSDVFEFQAVDEDNSTITYSVVPGEHALPPGLQLKDNQLRGIVGKLPASPKGTRYEFLIRATNQWGLFAERYFIVRGEYTSEPHVFRPSWISGMFEHSEVLHSTGASQPVYQIARANRGGTVELTVEIDNPDGDALVYRVETVPGVATSANVFNGSLPIGVKINGAGKIAGVVNVQENHGDYLFALRVSDAFGYSIVGYFCITLEPAVVVDPQPGSQLEWVTPAGSIGSIWESFPSHLGILARSPTGSAITYEMVSGGYLPSGMELDPQSGEIRGRAPFLIASAEYAFTARARAGATSIERDFTISVSNQYDNSEVMNVSASVTGWDRVDIGSWTWVTTQVPQEMIFRSSDSNFGRVQHPTMYLVHGLHYRPNEVLSYLQDYHHVMDLRLGVLKSAVARDRLGNHAYDVLYFDVIDPMRKAGGFNDTTEYEMLVNQQYSGSDLWNPDTGTARFYPNSLNNARKDLTVTQPDRVAPGLNGIEGMPMWMRCEQTPGDANSVLGFTPSVVIAYLKPNQGKIATSALGLRGINDVFAGRPFTVDRYLVTTMQAKITTTFDVGEFAGYATVDYDSACQPVGEPYKVDQHDGTQTVFDDPDSNRLLICCNPLDPYCTGEQPNTGEPTVWDLVVVETGKYYKFPPGDRK